MAKRKTFEVNQLVALNNTPTATLYRVKEVDGLMLGLIDATIEDKRPNQRIQYIDVSLASVPTAEQLAHHASS